MSKFNTPSTRVAGGTSPIRTASKPSGTTYEGGPGFDREAQSELFLLAVTNMVGEKTFYEPACNRDSRFVELVRRVAVNDPLWMVDFVSWLRNGANMRSASLVAAAEAVKALLGRCPGVPHEGHASTDWTCPLAVGTGYNRTLISSALQRADEPGEMLAYWLARYGRALPMPVKRGIADAALRLYAEYPLLKYDTGSHGVRFADVLELTHPGDRKGSSQGDRFAGEWQKDLFRHALDRRRNRGNPTPETLRKVRAYDELRRLAVEDPMVLLDSDRLRAAGMTWEDVLSLAGSKVDKRLLWEALIPSMGYSALLRNLRNFDEAGVSDAVAQTVATRLADPVEVARSRQLPMRFLSAHRAAPSLRWGYPLEQALDHSLANIPKLAGRTLVLVDTSGSMNESFSKDGSLKRWDAAVIFGVALAQRCAEVDVVSFSNGYWGGQGTKVFPLQVGESLLRAIERWKSGGWFLNGGTDTVGAVRRHFAGHDRVVIVTDEQAARDDSADAVDRAIPPTVPLYTWNLAGYRYGHAPSGTPYRHTFGGLTDQAFRMIPLLEAGRSQSWPWLF